MQDEADLRNYFTHEMLDKAVRLWTRSSIAIIDVRNSKIHSDKPLKHYRFPSSMLIFTYGGAAIIQLDQISYQSEQFTLIHGGKGTELTIHPTDAILQTYMIFYKAEAAPFYKRDVHRLLEHINPFIQVFGFSPNNPIFFMEQFEEIHTRWGERNSLHQFHAKILFYQLVHRMYEELYKEDVQFIEPDYVEWVKQYLDQHYREPISIQHLTEMLPLSRSMLSKLFKQQEKKSLQEYLIEKRLEAAKKYLLNSKATIQEIAAGCGFVDELNLIRMFKKHVRMTPSDYRRKKIPYNINCDIDNDSHYSYNEGGLDKLAKFKGDGELFMFGQKKSRDFIIVAAMSLMLLLSACGSSTPSHSGGEASSSPTQTQPTSDAGKKTGETAAQTRIIKTIYGDVEVPVNPERVGIWVYEQEIHSLGKTPVSISSGSYQNVWPDITVFSYAPDKEALMALDPDLLITYDDENFYNEYKSIAPVVNIPLATSSEDTLRLIGDLLNLSDKADEIIQQFNEQVEESKKLLEQSNALGKTAVLIEPLADDVWFFDNAYGRGGNILYEYLEFVIPDLVKEKMGDKHFMNVSFEVLPQYCHADYIVVVTGEGYDRLKEKEIWKSIPAVKNNRVIEFDGSVLSGRGLDTQTLSHFTDSFTAIK